MPLYFQFSSSLRGRSLKEEEREKRKSKKTSQSGSFSRVPLTLTCFVLFSDLYKNYGFCLFVVYQWRWTFKDDAFMSLRGRQGDKDGLFAQTVLMVRCLDG